MAIIERLKKKNLRASGQLRAGKTLAAKDLTDEERKMLGSIVYEPRVTEKAATFGGGHLYTFNVHPGASKREIRHAIEKMHRVTVVGVRTIRIHRKKRMRGRVEGWKKGYKKAMVKIKEGQTIEFGK